MIIKDVNSQFHLYSISLIISLLVGFTITYIELVKIRIKNDLALCSVLLTAFISIIFGKIYTMISDGNIGNILTTGFSSMGGLIGVIVGAIIFIKIYNDKHREIFQCYMLGVPIIYSISKIGCHLAGCCHGIEYNGILNIIYESTSACELNTPVFPIQIIEAIVFSIIFIKNYAKYLKGKYVVYNIIIECTLYKFLLDYFRYSHTNQIISFNQIICLTIMIITIVVMYYKEFHIKKIIMNIKYEIVDKEEKQMDNPNVVDAIGQAYVAQEEAEKAEAEAEKAVEKEAE